MRADETVSESTLESNREGATIDAASPLGGVAARAGVAGGWRKRRSPRDPSRTPDGRWRRAEAASHLAPNKRDKLDTVASHAAEWIARERLNGRRGRLPNRLKEIEAAVRLRDDSTFVDRIQLLVVADTPRELIAETLGVSSETIATFEALFFDVRDALDANDYLFLCVLDPLKDGRDDDYHLRLRLALESGPQAAVELLDATLPNEAARSFDHRERTMAACSAASGVKRGDEERRTAYLALAREYRAESDRRRSERDATAEREPPVEDLRSTSPDPNRASAGPGDASRCDGARPASGEIFGDPSSANSSPVKTAAARSTQPSVVQDDAGSARGRAIYDRLCRRAAPFPLPAPWEWLEAGRGTYRGFDDPPKILDELRRDFGDEAAVAAGAAERGSDGTLRLAEPIGKPDRPFLAMYDRRGGVLDLLTERGCLSGEKIPALVELEANVDSRAEEDVNSGGDEEGDEDEEYDPTVDLHVAFGIEDAAVLRACDFRATTAYGLDRLSPSHVERLAELMGWPEVWGARASGRGEAVRSRFQSITFAGWSPSTLRLEEPAELRRVAEAFAELEQLIDLRLHSACVWRPEGEAIERVKYCANYRDAHRVLIALRASASREFRRLSGFLDEPAPAPKPPSDLEEAARLHILPLSSDDQELREKSGDFYAYWISKRIVMPLIRGASEESDPAESARALKKALLTQTTLVQLGYVARAGSAFLSNPSPKVRKQLEGATERALKLCNQLDKDRRKDERCPNRTTIESVARRALSKPVPRAGSSDSD